MQSTQNKFSTVTLLIKLIYYSYFAIRKNRPRCFIKCHWPKVLLIWSNAQIDQMHLTTTLGHFTFWIRLSLRPKTETNGSTLVSVGVEFNQSLQLVIADVIGGSSLISPHFSVLLLNLQKVGNYLQHGCHLKIGQK